MRSVLRDNGTTSSEEHYNSIGETVSTSFLCTEGTQFLIWICCWERCRIRVKASDFVKNSFFSSSNRTCLRK